jgi:hypothetical protein
MNGFKMHLPDATDDQSADPISAGSSSVAVATDVAGVAESSRHSAPDSADNFSSNSVSAGSPPTSESSDSAGAPDLARNSASDASDSFAPDPLSAWAAGFPCAADFAVSTALSD